MDKIREWLKSRKVYWWSLGCGVALLPLGIMQYIGVEKRTMGITNIILGVIFIVNAFVKRTTKRVIDQASVEKSLRGTFEDMTPEELQEIMDNKRCSEEIKAVIRKILAEKQGK